MSSDEEDLSAEPRQLQSYTVDARWAQSATGETFCRNRTNDLYHARLPFDALNEGNSLELSGSYLVRGYNLVKIA